jgi:hypothetical protein
MQWEYGVLTFDRHGLATGVHDAVGKEAPTPYDHGQEIARHLKGMAEDGWELVAFVPAPQNQDGRWTYHGVFKRIQAQ